MDASHADVLSETLRRSHVSLVTAVPGHGATQTFAAWQRQTGDPFSFHEEVAVGMAHGAALRGHRAAVLLKAHGFLKAANAIADSLAAGTTAGLLYVVFHDPTGAHSDSIVEIEGAARELHLPVHRPAAPEAASTLVEALQQSEAQGLPHLVILNADAVTAPAASEPGDCTAPTVSYERDAARHVCCPLFASYQHAILQARRTGEALDSVERPALPTVPDGLPDAYRATATRFVPLFEALVQVPRAVTTGDTTIGTLFCLPPYEAVDLCTYMGGSLPLAAGGAAVGDTPAWAVTGDFGFVAAGHLGLLEAQQRGLPLKVVLLHNGAAQATGGQPVAPEAVNRVLAGYRDRIYPLDSPSDPARCRDALHAAAARDGLAIVHADYR